MLQQYFQDDHHRLGNNIEKKNNFEYQKAFLSKAKFDFFSVLFLQRRKLLSLISFDFYGVAVSALRVLYFKMKGTKREEKQQ